MGRETKKVSGAFLVVRINQIRMQSKPYRTWPVPRVLIPRVLIEQRYLFKRETTIEF